jgi:hypothetical protein
LLNAALANERCAIRVSQFFEELIEEINPLTGVKPFPATVHFSSLLTLKRNLVPKDRETFTRLAKVLLAEAFPNAAEDPQSVFPVDSADHLHLYLFLEQSPSVSPELLERSYFTADLESLDDFVSLVEAIAIHSSLE